ncbi:MAG: hypothetical protein RIR26_2883 [Pseudomonadota bacterium]
MFSELEKKIETYSADDELSMRQRAIDEGRMGRQIELGTAYKRGKDRGCEEAWAGGETGVACSVPKDERQRKSGNFRGTHAP